MKEAKRTVLDYFAKNKTMGKDKEELYINLLDGLLEQKEKQTIGSSHPLYNLIKEIALLSPNEKLLLLRSVFKEIHGRKGILTVDQEMINFIFELVKPLIEDKEKVEIFNPFAGIGSLSGLFAEKLSSANIVSQEINPNLFKTQKKIFKLCDLNVEVNQGNSLEFNRSNKLDLIIATPPFGGKIEMDNLNLEGYDKDEFKRLSYEEAFILKSLDLVKENGFIVGVLPPSILFKRGNSKKIREIILEEAQVLSIIETAKEVLSPASAITPVIVILKKKSNEEHKPENLLVASFEEIEIESDEFKEDSQELLKQWEKFIREEV